MRSPNANALQMIAAGGRLRSAMKQRAFSARMLSEATGLSPSTIYHFLHAEREMHLDDLRKISSALQVSAGWIAWGQ